MLILKTKDLIKRDLENKGLSRSNPENKGLSWKFRKNERCGLSAAPFVLDLARISPYFQYIKFGKTQMHGSCGCRNYFCSEKGITPGTPLSSFWFSFSVGFTGGAPDLVKEITSARRMSGAGQPPACPAFETERLGIIRAVPATIHSAEASAKTAASRAWFFFALFPVAYGLSVALLHLKATWDDAAITAAFARTWAQTGHIALTPVSQTVEGFSSVLWFLLLSIPYFFTHSPMGLVWMKVLSALFFALSIGLTYSIAKRQLRSEQAGIICALLFALCVTPLREMQNGMEMNLTTFLVLALFRVLVGERRRILYGSAIASLLLLARFESPFMLLLMFCGFVVAGNHRRELIKIALIATSAFLLIELTRHHLFGVWMPNTVYAKRFPPYSNWSTPKDFLRTRAFAILEVLLVLPVPIFAAILRRRNPKVHPAVWSLASGCVLFGAMFGHNMGPPGRMVEPMLPFLLVVLVGACSFRAASVGFTLLLCAQGIVWGLEQSSVPYGNASIAKVQALGLTLDSVRASLHRDELVVMISDVGGSALCCERLDIVDSGLLANPTLAHTGWSGFPTQFRKVNPDVVEAHRPWSDASRIFSSGLLDNYCPIASHGLTLYMRRDLRLGKRDSSSQAKTAWVVPPVHRVCSG